MATGLRTVLSLVQKHQQLCVFWTVNYSLEDPGLRTHMLGQLRKPRCKPTTSFPNPRHPSLSLSSWSHCTYPGGVHGGVEVPPEGPLSSFQTRQPSRGAAVLGQDWALPNVLTSFSLSPAPRPPHGLAHPPAPSLLPSIPTCLSTRSAPQAPDPGPCRPYLERGPRQLEATGRERSSLGDSGLLDE